MKHEASAREGGAVVWCFALRGERLVLFFNNLEEDIVFSLFDLDTGCDCIHNESKVLFEKTENCGNNAGLILLTGCLRGQLAKL